MNNPSRVAFTLFGRDVYWYGVLMALGILIAVWLTLKEGKRKRLTEDDILDMCLVIIPSGVVGARLYYVIFEWASYASNPIRALYIWEGGLAIYGAVIGGLLGMFIYSRVRKIRFLKLADCIAPGLVLAQAIGRWGNFFNQEAYGLPVTPEMLAAHPILGYFPISVAIEGTHYFDKAVCTACATAANGAHLHLATFFYESAWCLIVFVVLWLTRKRVKHDGDTFFLYVLLYSLERTFVEGLRGDSLWIIKPSAAGMTDGVRVSQALSFLLFVGVLVFFIIRAVREKKEGRLMWPKPIAVCECANEAEAKCECECECCKAEDNAAEESTEADAEDKEETTQTNDDNTENEEGEGKE